jgi:hypothetical protein
MGAWYTNWAVSGATPSGDPRKSEVREMTKELSATIVAMSILTAPAASAPQTPPAAQDAAQTACAVAAFNSYNQANLALLQAAQPLRSVESIVAQRRLQEQFCLRFARCAFGDPTNPSLNVKYSVSIPRQSRGL